MAREMKHMGRYILNKQCENIKISPDDIKPQDLTRLATAITEAIIVFTGREKAERIGREIKRLL
jgi:hypothetical protein